MMRINKDEQLKEVFLLRIPCTVLRYYRIRIPYQALNLAVSTFIQKPQFIYIRLKIISWISSILSSFKDVKFYRQNSKQPSNFD